MMISVIPLVQGCPFCGAKPDIDQVAPWSKENGPTPWYAGCYRTIPVEHFIGVNGDTRLATVEAWNTEVAKIEAMKPKEKA